MIRQRLQRVDGMDGVVLILPPDVLAHLRLGIGDLLHATLTAKGVELSAMPPGQGDWSEGSGGVAGDERRT